MDGENQTGLCVELTQYFSMSSAFSASGLYSWALFIGSSAFHGPPRVGKKTPFPKSWRKCRDALVHAVGMVILQHGFNPADQIHHANQDDFRLSSGISIVCTYYLRTTLRGVLGWQSDLGLNQKSSRNSVELLNKLQFNRNKLAVAI